jgi:glycosyltransferase involved in cell wall biosynthesis
MHPDLVKELEESHQELKGMSLVLSSQTYGHVDPDCVRSIRQACFHASNHGLQWVGDVSADRMGYGAARNHACEQLVENQELAKGIMWIDSDIQPEPNAITRLLWTARRGGYDFVTGVYHHRAGAFHPVIYNWVPRSLRKRAGFIICDAYPPDTIAKMGGCGFGFVYTSLKLILDIKASKGWKEKAGKWFPDKRDVKDGYGEDMSFCILAREAGHQLYVNTGVQVGHTGDAEVITGENFNRRVLEEARKDGRILPGMAGNEG